VATEADPARPAAAGLGLPSVVQVPAAGRQGFRPSALAAIASRDARTEAGGDTGLPTMAARAATLGTSPPPVWIHVC
jgi:hypothetical protein